jgi:hypothetical protein
MVSIVNSNVMQLLTQARDSTSSLRNCTTKLSGANLSILEALLMLQKA